MAIKVWWSSDDSEWIAIDSNHAGLSSWGDTANEALRELKIAQKSWDEQHAREQVRLRVIK